MIRKMYTKPMTSNGRCTDHASKDIRGGWLGRGQAMELVKKHDSAYPNDIKRWLEYTGMTKEDFDSICDTYRDPRVWRLESGEWVKDNPWDKHE